MDNSPSDSVQDDSRQIAALDLGSNSFHLVVAKVVGNDIQIVSRHKQRVRLAQGLDEQNNLSNQAIERGLDCLAAFAERLSGFDVDDVRIAATHTLRVANNAHIFLQRAAQILPFPIEIIPGTEEARLIYLGVSHTQVEADKKLVIDIGGGSTELVIGEELEPIKLTSTLMGCVSFTERFFSKGKLSANRFKKAQVAAQQQLEHVKESYLKTGWTTSIGSSGTVKAIREVVIGQGHDDGVITPKRLKTLIESLCEFEHIDDIKLSKLPSERLPVFAAGVAILYAIMKVLQISELHYSSGALREGILYEMDSRFDRTDIRMRTAETLAQKYAVELSHAENVKATLDHLLCQYLDQTKLKKKRELSQLLGWAALLHEVGLSIHFQGHHKHSAYLLQHSYMPGFNREHQLLLATLSRFQRKTIKLTELRDFYLFRKKDVLDLIKLFRLSIVLNSQRDNDPVYAQLDVSDESWVVSLEDELFNHPVLSADFDNEIMYWDKVEWNLVVNNV
ncbi:exopolyphosphatase [Vibrio ulleungensis]|uniref:Exopolyphosphatase n=1 Tax=Vibrio ulleungensis TaxID=2807619 RepID=A0ABS2HEY4_9VIBR|nr:exopolyphosphatase [Vibrio ulleungensis]MBM7035651.1 exopolyphosphatase [Vibrio ulleungensis]